MPSISKTLLLLLGVTICGLTSSTNGALLPVEPAELTGESRDTSNGRLPGGFIPSHYDIEIAPDFYDGPADPLSAQFSFRGSVTIHVLCLVNSISITLNSKGLTINGVSVTLDPGSAVSADEPPQPEVNVIPKVELLTLNFTANLVANASYIIQMNYSGPIVRPDSRGIYYDYYKDSNNRTIYMVATQFESVFARQMLPCFDEPDLKATFNVTVLRKPSVISLANMNLVRNETREDGWIADVYAQSPVMSTYLLCVCIGNFSYVEADWQNYTNHPIRIYSRPEMIENLEYARHLAPIIHQWLEKETGISYGLPKMDHIALPSKGGAMENWGLITYGESSLCINPKTSGALSKLNVASIISHELAHQWYGNLVTSKWWNHIWLNEGFATHYNYYPLEAIGWPASENQQADPRRGTQQFMDIDQRNNSDPVIKDITTSAMAPDAFSGSTYPKGGAIVRMLKGLLTRATMNKGFTAYLKKFESNSATTDDLWEVLTEYAARDNITNGNGDPLNVKDVMDPWLKQMGFPFVTVTSVGNGKASLTASRYLSPRGQAANIPSAEFNYRWTVPISIATPTTQDWEDIRPQFYLRSDQDTIQVDYDKWLVINANEMFFYRVNYDSTIRAALVDQLNTSHSMISSESRGQLIDDSFSLARSLVIDETEALETTRYLGSERQYSAWNAALKHLLYADKIYQGLSWYSKYATYVTSLLQPVYNATGWVSDNTEAPLTQALRKDVLTTLCYYGDAECVAQAQARFDAYSQTPDVDSVDPNLLPNVLCVGIKNNASTAVWNVLFDQYQRRRPSPLNDERYAYLYGMSCSTRYQTFLELAVGGYWIDGRDQTTALNYLAQNSKGGRDVVWEYLEDNWRTVLTAVSKFAVLRNVASTWRTQDELNAFEAFFTKVAGTETNSNVNLLVQIRLLIQQNIDWFTANANAVEKWLQPDIESSTAGPTTGTTQAVTQTTETPTTVISTTSSSCKCQAQLLLAIPMAVLTFISMYLNHY